MFGYSIKTRQNVTGPANNNSPRNLGTPRGTCSPLSVNSPRNLGETDSPVGEIDTAAPFESVRAAVSLFGEVSSPKKNKPIIVKKIKTAEERVLEKETQLHLALKELDKFREHLKNAESTKGQALRELEKANRTLEELTGKLETISESKQTVIQATEAAKKRAKELEDAKSNKAILNDGDWKQNVDTEREQYKASAGELISVKQELTNLRQDFDAALEKKVAAFQQAADAQHTAKVNQEKVTGLSNEIANMRKTLEQVKFASDKAQNEHLTLMEQKEARLQSHITAKEVVEKKIQSLKEEAEGPELSGNLEEKMEETTEAIKVLEEQLKNVHTSDQESLSAATFELDDAKKMLQEVSVEEGSIRGSVEPLKLEIENVKREKFGLKEKEVQAELLTKTLQVELEKSKEELEAAAAEQTKAGDEFDNLQLKLQELSSEAESIRKEIENINRNIAVLKQEAETSRAIEKEAGVKLEIALKEVEEAKAAEKLANDQMHSSSTSTIDAQVNHSGKIKLATEEFESLTSKAKEVENLADMKVATAMAQVEAINASEREALGKLEESMKETEDIEAATKEAMKQAEMAEAAKLALEGELRRLHQLETSFIKEEAEM